MYEFFKQYLTATAYQLYICSLPNVKGDDHERHVLTRDVGVIKKFVEKHDVKGRGVFYCVGTLLPRAIRNKANIQEVCFLHADVDFKSIDATPEGALKTILALPLPPSRIHATGNGYHCLWWLKTATTEFERHEAALKRLADVVGGDKQVTHRAALLRLPGTHNSKNDQWTEVKVVHNT